MSKPSANQMTMNDVLNRSIKRPRTQRSFLLTGQSLPRFSNKPNESNRLRVREIIGPINKELTIQSTLFSIASLCLSGESHDWPVN
jgi:hypothetical protein